MISNVFLLFTNNLMHLNCDFITKRYKGIPDKWNFVFHTFNYAVNEEVINKNLSSMVSYVFHVRLF